MSYYGTFDLGEVISFLKERDYSFFDFFSDYSDEDAVISIKEKGELYICNVSEDYIPEQTAGLVIDVLEHLDECLDQAYDWLAFWDFKNGEWKSGEKWVIEWCKENIHDRVKNEFEVSEIFFGMDDWPVCDKKEYCLGPDPKKGTDTFSIEFRVREYPLGFNLKFLCENRRLYKIIIHIL